MQLTKQELQKVAVRRCFAPYFKSVMVCCGLTVAWTLVFGFISGRMEALDKWVFLGIEALPAVILILWLLIYQKKENRYVKEFLKVNGYLIGKEI
jgi:hypothetical protein